MAGGDPLSRVSPGETRSGFPAAAFNEFADAARSIRQRTGGVLTGAGITSSVVMVRNDSGADRGRFGVLAISGIVFTPTDNQEEFTNRVTLKGIAPTSAYTSRFAVLAEPIPSGQLGRAYLDGVCQARIKGAGSAGDTVDIEDGQAGWLLVQHGGAATILWCEAGSGERWAIVKFGGAATQPILWGVMCESYTAFEAIDVPVWEGVPAGSGVATGETVAAIAWGEAFTYDADGLIGYLIPIPSFRAVSSSAPGYLWVPAECVPSGTCS